MSDGRIAGFVIWLLAGGLLTGRGIYVSVSKKALPFGFWANAEMFPVKDVKAYNRALGRLFILYGIVFMALGLPLLAGQNSPAIIFSILGVVAESIAAMAVYVLVIQDKYEEK